MLGGRIIQFELVNGKFIKETYEDGSSLAFSRYDIMDGGRDVWQPERLNRDEWEKVGEHTYRRMDLDTKL